MGGDCLLLMLITKIEVIIIIVIIVDKIVIFKSLVVLTINITIFYSINVNNKRKIVNSFHGISG